MAQVNSVFSNSKSRASVNILHDFVPRVNLQLNIKLLDNFFICVYH